MAASVHHCRHGFADHHRNIGGGNGGLTGATITTVVVHIDWKNLLKCVIAAGAAAADDDDDHRTTGVMMALPAQ